MALKKLSPQHKLFAKEYVANGFNAAKAYREVYGPDTSEASAGPRLARDPLIQEEVRREMHERCEALQINEDRVLIKLAEMAFADKDDEVYGPTVQLKALDMLQKQLGLQKQNIKAEVDNRVNIEVTIDES